MSLGALARVGCCLRTNHACLQSNLTRTVATYAIRRSPETWISDIFDDMGMSGHSLRNSTTAVAKRLYQQEEVPLDPGTPTTLDGALQESDQVGIRRMLCPQLYGVYHILYACYCALKVLCKAASNHPPTHMQPLHTDQHHACLSAGTHHNQDGVP